MNIRHASADDIPRIMEIYSHARAFMAEHGNPNQWGPTRWPPEALIRSDISSGHSYVCVEDERIVGVFFFSCGEDVEPAYRNMEGGRWQTCGPYGVIHRIASDGSVHGVGSFCIAWALAKCPHLRMDTHPDNFVMQRLLEKCGFVRCGIVHVEEDSNPRLAYEKTASV